MNLKIFERNQEQEPSPASMRDFSRFSREKQAQMFATLESLRAAEPGPVLATGDIGYGPGSLGSDVILVDRPRSAVFRYRSRRVRSERGEAQLREGETSVLAT
jgi:hypothetical protein